MPPTPPRLHLRASAHDPTTPAIHTGAVRRPWVCLIVPSRSSRPDNTAGEVTSVSFHVTTNGGVCCAVRAVLVVHRVIAAQLFRTLNFEPSGGREKKDEIDFFEIALRDRQGWLVG